jgi:hypothetical protein
VTVLGLTLLSLFVSVALSFQSQLNLQQASLFETCTTTWKLGFGAGRTHRREADLKSQAFPLWRLRPLYTLDAAYGVSMTAAGGPRLHNPRIYAYETC